MSNDHLACNAHEQAVLDHARNGVETRRERDWIGDGFEVAIEDEIAAVGEQAFVVFHARGDAHVFIETRAYKQFAQQAFRALPSERNHFNGQWKAAETLEDF